MQFHSLIPITIISLLYLLYSISTATATTTNQNDFLFDDTHESNHVSNESKTNDDNDNNNNNHNNDDDRYEMIMYDAIDSTKSNKYLKKSKRKRMEQKRTMNAYDAIEKTKSIKNHQKDANSKSNNDKKSSGKRKVKTKRRRRKVISKDMQSDNNNNNDDDDNDNDNDNDNEIMIMAGRNNKAKSETINFNNDNVIKYQENQIVSMKRNDNQNTSKKLLRKSQTIHKNNDSQFHKHRQMFHQHEKEKQQQKLLLKQLQMNHTKFENLDKKPYVHLGVSKPKSSATATATATATTTTTTTTTQWIQNYLTKNRREHLLPIPRDFIVDGFNLQKLQNIVELHTSLPYETFRAALRLILDQEPNQLSLSASIDEVQYVATNILYPLLHARFIISPRGLGTVYRALKQNDALFGRCPRLHCNGMPLLPCGLSDQEIGQGNCMRYCCSCGEVISFI